MESTDENLGDVLRERSLQAAEAQQVLRALVQGLTAIHAAGLVHGRMEPASVLAMGETIKLRSDCVQIGGADFAMRSAEDVRGLARIVTQGMTGRIPASENDPLLQLLPEPMARAVRRALSGNAHIAEIAALAGVVIVPASRAPESTPVTRMGPVAVPAPMTPTNGAPSPAPAPPDSAAVPVSPTAKPEEYSIANTAQPAFASAKIIALLPAGSRTEPPKQPEANVRVAPDLPAPPIVSNVPMEPIGRFERAGGPVNASALDDETLAGAQRRSAPLVMAIAAILVIATLWALYGMLHPGHTASSPKNAPPPIAIPASSSQHATAVAHAPGQGSGSAAVAITTPGWRVVAYTYRHEAQAEHKAEVIRQRFPQLAPGVFALHGAAPYLVTLGGVMSKTDAFAFRNRAVQMGMPRDTYAQNYR
jgi:hypothetical protein